MKGNFVDAEVKSIENFDLLENRLIVDEEIDASKFNRFLKKDIAYLKSREFTETELKKEIAFIDRLIYENSQYFVTTKKKSIVYPPNTVGNLDVYGVAKENRENLLKSQKKTSLGVRGSTLYFPQKPVRARIKGYINGEKLLTNYREAINVLDNIMMPEEYFKYLVVSISPYKLESIDGFAEYTGAYNEGATIILGREIKNVPANSEYYKREIRSTMLHELGHIYHYMNTREYNKADGVMNFKNLFWREYANLYGGLISKTYNKSSDSWETDIAENFAEDFRIYYSRKLGKYSFKPKDKRTRYDYDKGVELFIDKNISDVKENNRPLTNKDFLMVNGMEEPFDNYDTKTFASTDHIAIELRPGSDPRKGYIKTWSRDLARTTTKKLYLGEDDEYIIEPGEDIGVVIKYVKVGNDHQPIWRINIK